MSLRNIFLYLLYVAAIVALTVAIITAFDHSSTKPKPKAPSGGSSQTAPKKPGSSPKKPGGAASQPAKPSTGTTTPRTSSPQTAQKPSQAAPTKSGQLTDTGPGDLVALFVGSTLAGVIGYRAYLRRQLA